ncbi:MAG: hypothetical protein ACXWQQ_00100 [Pseudobdellovibrio sp.]
MKNLILALTAVLSTQSAMAWVGRDVTCIASDGLTLNVPNSRNFYMQPIDLSNGYDVNFLGNLIARHGGQKTTDKNVHINISMNNCVQKDDLSLVCKDDNGFGNASYGYSLNSDYVSVETPVAGRVSLTLARDEKGIFQMALTIVNSKIKNGVLVIKKSIGPLSDPTQTSLTPWTPGCLIAAPESNNN